jgi:hypothetical protein
MLLAGLVPVVVGVVSGWNTISGLAFLLAFAPIGAALMAVARSRGSEEWRQGR